MPRLRKVFRPSESRKLGSEALNLEAIYKAIDQHNERCDYPAHTIVMAPFEVERLGWEEIRGCQVVADEKMQTGRFRLLCDRPKTGEHMTEGVREKVPA